MKESATAKPRLVPVDWAAHGRQLQRWLESDAVRRWWGDPVACLEIVTRTPADSHAVITADGTAVGYVCWQTYDRGDLDLIGLPSLPTGAIDIDLFIGESDWRGRGLGAAVLRQLTDRLARQTSALAAGLCTSVRNTPAHRAFTKAGFENRATFVDPEVGRCFVFVKDLRH